MNNDTKAAARRTPPSDKASETEYVAREAADAKSALLSSVANLKTSAADSLDIRKWAQRYPLRTAGAAMLAGFVAAAWAKGRRKPTTESGANPATAGDVSQGDGAPPQAKSSGEASSRSAFTALIITALLDVVKTAAQTFLLNTFRPLQDVPSPSEMDEDATGDEL